MVPTKTGKIEFTNLQFEKSNSVKRPQQQSEYFHIVVAIYAKCQDSSMFHILSKISPKIIVRGQNPGMHLSLPLFALPLYISIFLALYIC